MTQVFTTGTAVPRWKAETENLCIQAVEQEKSDHRLKVFLSFGNYKSKEAKIELDPFADVSNSTSSLSKYADL